MTRSQKLVVLLAAIVSLPSAAFAEDIGGYVAAMVLFLIVPATLVAGSITAGVVRAFTKRPGPWYLIPLYALGWFAIVIAAIWIHYVLQSVWKVI